jgi:colanic acid/amylovoran biosynthesis glycosyltransferase
MPENDLILFTYNFPFGKGESFLENEVRILCKYFRNIHIFPLSYGESSVSRHLPPGVSVSAPLIKFDLKKDKFKLLFSGVVNLSPCRFAITELFEKKAWSGKNRFIDWLGSTLITRILLSATIQRTISKQIGQTTLFYFYWGDKSTAIIPFLRQKLNNPIIVRFHGSDLYEELKGWIPFRQQLLQNIDYAIFISQVGKDYLEKRYSNSKLNSYIFRLGVTRNTPSKFSHDRKLRIISCSNIIPLKRIHLIYESLVMLPFPVSWIHLGSGPLLNYFREKVLNAPSHIEIEFKGYLENNKILQFYAENPVDLFINVSESEGIPVSVMEAISCGIPIIATNVGGTSEIVNGMFGYLLSANPSAKQISDTISEYYKLDQQSKMQMKYAALQHWETFFDAEKNYTEFAEFLKGISKEN